MTVAPAWKARPQPAGSSSALDASLGNQIATVEQLIWSGILDMATLTAAKSYPFFIAQFPCVVKAASIAVWSSGQPADDTNFWTVKLRRSRFGAASTGDIASKTTKATFPGELIVQRQAWSFDNATFDPVLSILQRGDILDFNFNTTGAPVSAPAGGLAGGIAASVRLEPLA